MRIAVDSHGAWVTAFRPEAGESWREAGVRVTKGYGIEHEFVELMGAYMKQGRSEEGGCKLALTTLQQQYDIPFLEEVFDESQF